MPCYRCGTRQVDPEPGKPSPWHRGVVREHQVLICPGCYPAALAELTRCPRCDSGRLVRQLDQVECLDCRLTRDADTDPAVPAPCTADPGGADQGAADSAGAAPGGGDPGDPGAANPGAADSAGAAPRAADPDLAAEVARALQRVLGTS